MNYVKQLSIALLVLSAVSAVSASEEAPADRGYVLQAKDWVKGRTNTQLGLAAAGFGVAAVAAYNFSETFKNAVDNSVTCVQDTISDAKECKDNAHFKVGGVVVALGAVAGAAYYKRATIKTWWNS